MVWGPPRCVWARDPRQAHRDITPLAPHKRLPELPVLLPEKPTDATLPQSLGCQTYQTKKLTNLPHPVHYRPYTSVEWMNGFAGGCGAHPLNYTHLIPESNSILFSRTASQNTLIQNRPKLRRRQWHPTPVLLPGQRSLVGCNPWGR